MEILKLTAADIAATKTEAKRGGNGSKKVSAYLPEALYNALAEVEVGEGAFFPLLQGLTDKQGRAKTDEEVVERMLSSTRWYANDAFKDVNKRFVTKRHKDGKGIIIERIIDKVPTKAEEVMVYADVEAVKEA